MTTDDGRRAVVPVVLVHGFGTSGQRTWGDNGWLDLLADDGRRAVTIDLLGHGRAPKPHDPAAYDRLEELVALELPAGPVDAIGFSLGARVLLTIAAEQPGRFRRLVVAGVGENLFRHEDTEALARVLTEADVPGAEGHPLATYFRQLASAPDADPLALAAYLRRPGHRPLSPDRLAAIDVPVLVVLGEHDYAGPADPLVEALADARLVVLRGVDHFATPKSFDMIDATLRFLDET